MVVDTSPELGGLASASTPLADSARGTTSNDQWRVFLGIALLVASYIFRVEVVRFTLRLAKRAVPTMLVWFKEFEKTLLLPLSWVVFVLLVWFSTYVMDLASLLDMDSVTIASVIRLFLGVPLIWTVICLCNYVIWGIIRVKGWNRAATKEDDDYNRVMIITEGIGVIKILLVAYVVSSFMFDGIGRITNFDSSQLTTVAVLVIELVALFGAHTWLKNTMGGLIALLDEQVKSGVHVRFMNHEGVVERLFLQCFCIRRYDKGVVYIPNGLMLEHSFEIKTKAIDQRSILSVHLDHGTDAASTRRFIQELDSILLRLSVERQQRSKSNVLGLDRKPLSGLIFFASSTGKALTSDEEEYEKPRYWISVTAPYVVQVVYYTQHHHVKEIKAEKTELVLQITDLLTKQRLRLHRTARLAFDLVEDDKLSPSRPASPEPRSEPLLVGRAAERPDLFQKFASEGNVLRQRRGDVSRTR